MGFGTDSHCCEGFEAADWPTVWEMADHSAVAGKTKCTVSSPFW